MTCEYLSLPGFDFGFIWIFFGQIPNPNDVEVEKGRRTVYDTWKVAVPELDEAGNPTGKPRCSTTIISH